MTLDNAAKFTEKGHIVLTVEENKEHSTPESISVSLTIADTGKGMSETQLSKAFQPYEQVFNDNEVCCVGTGLGLPISKQLTELMGGAIEVDSVFEEGTTMRLTMPFAHAKRTDTVTGEFESRFLSGMKVLVVDDSKLTLSGMEKIISRCGAEFIAAQSGEETVAIIRDCNRKDVKFDIIILDFLMKGMDGIESARAIQSEITYTPIYLMLTSFENLVTREELAWSSIVDVIEKPIVPALFVAHLESILKREKPTECSLNCSALLFNDTRILVCDDIEINQEVMTSMLEQFGIKSVTAIHGRQVLDMLNNGEVFDLIFMDLRMPVMNGFEATRSIRSIQKYNKTPIISMSADAMIETMQKCSEIGMDDFIAKPIEMHELERILLKWIPIQKRKYKCGDV